MYKNVASQKVAVYAHDTSADTPKTGDASNITANYSLDGVDNSSNTTNDANPTELDATDFPGVYIFDMTQGETNGDLFVLAASSTTADIEIEPVIIYTIPGTGTALDATVISTDLLVQCLTNKRYLEQASDGVWYLHIRNSGDSDDIVNKALKDKDGNDITDLTAGILAQELANSV